MTPSHLNSADIIGIVLAVLTALALWELLWRAFDLYDYRQHRKTCENCQAEGAE